MKTKYIVMIQIEECRIDGEYCEPISATGEARNAGSFETEELAHKHVERLLEQGNATGTESAEKEERG